MSKRVRDQLFESLQYEDSASDSGVRFGRVVSDRATYAAVSETAQNVLGRPVTSDEMAGFCALLDAFEGLIQTYESRVAKDAATGLLEALEHALGRPHLDRLLTTIATEYPDAALSADQPVEQQLLASEARRASAAKALILLWLAGQHPPASGLSVLLEDGGLQKSSHFLSALDTARTYFDGLPRFGAEGLGLLETLEVPLRKHPSSAFGQLEYVANSWSDWLPQPLLNRLHLVLDVARESLQVRDEGPGPVEVPHFGPPEDDWWRLRSEVDWMPRLVLLAKNVHVWLDQLGQRSGEQIDRLDQVPDWALEELAAQGFTGLWLIGLWQRSTASLAIKRHSGDPDAIASAYSIDAYRIADSLGGTDAVDRFRERALAHGIRLGADMVPNHTGLLSRWIVEHPEWFVQTEKPPYPSYRFEGPNLSDDPRVLIQIEDGYWDRTDAAVVFKHTDQKSGQVRYIYHGNDGTQMPWNDTAQLDFRRADVREAVKRTIVEVARRFPVVRFDAAMTLTRYHYQRLWFPESGSAGAVPSRAHFGMPKSEFEASVPTEFWRDVITAAAEEAPDALLMAEAFWLTESFFIRELGMHRVYNSAFMVMLRDQDNARYRKYLSEILATEPAVLSRFVNFMTNPDEETAAGEFGKGDKYFGVATVLLTMPGLPMFGHGQVEGLEEKYGMEFLRAKRDERPDPGFLDWHDKQLRPIFDHRPLFNGTDDFLLFDVVDDHGQILEDVFAYTNFDGETAALVLYNNQVDRCRGWLKESVPTLRTGNVIRVTLSDAFALEKRGLTELHLAELRAGTPLRLSAANSTVEIDLNGYESRVYLST